MTGFRDPGPPLPAARFYDCVAPVYDRDWAYPPRTTAAQAAFLIRLCQRGPVLDLGCGTGRMLDPLARAGLAPVGLDCSQQMLAIARAKHPRANLVMADMAAPLPFAAASFGAAFCLHATANHLPEPEDLALLAAEALRVLRPGCHLVLELPHPACFPGGRGWRPFRPGVMMREAGPGREQMALTAMEGVSTEIALIGPEELRDVLAGFTRVELRAELGPRRYTPRRGRTLVVLARAPGLVK